MTLYPEDILKLLLALALGGIIGAERELRDKDAGFRTLMFICAGSALFTIFSIRIASPGGFQGDPARIAAQIVSGIGFLGAGVILREHGEIRGLTTASTIWLAAALGVGVGVGQILFSVLAAAMLLLALWVFPSLERMMGTVSQVRTYTITTTADRQRFTEITERFRTHNLLVMKGQRTREGEDMICTWMVSGRPKNHEAMSDELFDDPLISRFES